MIIILHTHTHVHRELSRILFVLDFKTVPHQFESSWWLMAEREDNDDSNSLHEDNTNHDDSFPPAKRFKLSK